MVQHTVVLWALAASTTWESQAQTAWTEKGFWVFKNSAPYRARGGMQMHEQNKWHCEATEFWGGLYTATVCVKVH